MGQEHRREAFLLISFQLVQRHVADKELDGSVRVLALDAIEIDFDELLAVRHDEVGEACVQLDLKRIDGLFGIGQRNSLQVRRHQAALVEGLQTDVFQPVFVTFVVRLEEVDR